MSSGDHQTPAAARKSVVIVGGGYAGASIAKFLEISDVPADVTLIDNKEYFVHHAARSRLQVDPQLGKDACFRHSAYLSRTRVLVGEAVGITDTREVALATGERVPFDIAVLATGSSCAGQAPDPRTLEEKAAQIAREHLRLRSARSVLILGGGPSGVELAGEIATDFPEKKVTLVHSGERLLGVTGSRAAGAKARRWLQARGVEVLLGELQEDLTLDPWDRSGAFVTQSGKEVLADHVFVATGFRPNTAWLPELFPREEGFIRVDRHLRVKGQTNIFCVGDANNVIPKSFGQLRKQTIAVAVRIIREVHGGTPALGLMKAHPAESSSSVITLGRNDGLLCTPFGAVSGSLPMRRKSKDIFIPTLKVDLGIEGH